MKNLKLNKWLLLLYPLLPYGCGIVKPSTDQQTISQHVIRYAYVASLQERTDSYVYGAMSGDTTMVIIQPKDRCRKALCRPQAYYHLVLEEVHQFGVPSGIPIEKLSDVPYAISHRGKIVYVNGWLEEKTDCPVFLLIDIQRDNSPVF